MTTRRTDLTMMHVRSLSRAGPAPPRSPLHNQGWFFEEEGRWYAALGAEIPHGGCAVEVGSWKGLSTSYLGPVCRDRGATLWCVDTWKGSHDSFAERYAAVMAAEDVRATFERNMQELGVPVRILAEPSVEAAGRFEDGSCDLVFLDAAHDEESVAADLRAWVPKIKPGGVLAGHDLCPKTPGVGHALMQFVPETGLDLELGPGRLWSLRLSAPA